jgi:hypothetical protein
METKDDQEDTLETEIEDEWFTETDSKTTIKNASPFTQVFSLIEKSVRSRDNLYSWR